MKHCVVGASVTQSSATETVTESFSEERRARMDFCVGGFGLRRPFASEACRGYDKVCHGPVLRGASTSPRLKRRDRKYGVRNSQRDRLAALSWFLAGWRLAPCRYLLAQKQRKKVQRGYLDREESMG